MADIKLTREQYERTLKARLIGVYPDGWDHSSVMLYSMDSPPCLKLEGSVSTTGKSVFYGTPACADPVPGAARPSEFWKQHRWVELTEADILEIAECRRPGGASAVMHRYKAFAARAVALLDQAAERLSFDPGIGPAGLGLLEAIRDEIAEADRLGLAWRPQGKDDAATASDIDRGHRLRPRTTYPLLHPLLAEALERAYGPEAACAKAEGGLLTVMTFMPPAMSGKAHAAFRAEWERLGGPEIGKLVCDNIEPTQGDEP